MLSWREGVGSLFRRTRFQIDRTLAEKDSRPRSVAANGRPRASTIHVCIAKPLSSDEISKLDDKSLVVEVERRKRDCHQQAKAGRSR